MGLSAFFQSSRLPVIYQTEVTECGLACVAMIARYHGHDIDLNGLRKEFPVSMMGATLKSLIATAHQLDLGARALRLELENLSELQTPAILHWDMNHFVVLKKVVGNKVYIHDPARGPRVLPLKTVSDHFTGVALELTPLSDFAPITQKDEMRISHLWDRLVGWKRATLQLLVLSLILQALILAAPFYLQLAVDEAISKFDLNFLMLLALAFGGLAIIQVATKMLREWVILHFGYQMSFQMVSNIFRHLIHLPTAFFEKRHIGDVLSRMRSTAPIQTALTQSVVAAIIDGLMAIITGIVIFIYSPLLGLIVLLSVVLLLIFTFAFYPVLRNAQEEMIVNEALENTHRIETIRASTAIKLFSAESQRMSVWRNLYVDFVNAGITHGKYGVFQRAAQDLINLLQIVLVVFFGARLILSGSGGFTVGMLFAFMAYRQSFTDSVISLFNKFIEFKLLSLHLERIADIAKAEPELASGTKPWAKAGALKGRIEIKHLSFRYSPADPWILEDLNLVIEAGEFTALTGPSGAGKTTLMKLILGLYPPSKGEILIDGEKLTAQNRAAWRHHIGVVMQDDKLLSGSIAENISFFNPQVDIKRVAKAASKAKIHDEINAMPMGYESMIGDMGSVLSGGQKQRVLLARALYKNPEALFLDEGTANLDRETEKLIVDIIEKMPMTRVIVAHRQEFLKRVDKTIVIE